MSIAERLKKLKSELPENVTLVAVSKTHSVESIWEAYQEGQRVFGENKVQELTAKVSQLPEDIEWHLIGHLQTNKVKYIAPFVRMIHSVDSLKLLQEINKQALKNGRVMDCLLQVHVAKEESKFGFDAEECKQVLFSAELGEMKGIHICGLMGMATNSSNEALIREEFSSLRMLFQECCNRGASLKILSMGMSSDYRIAIEEGSTMVRIGSTLFGERNYTI